MTIDLTSSEQIILIALLIVWAALLFGGFIVGKENADHTRRMPLWTRMTSSFTLVIAAAAWWSILNGKAGYDDLSTLALFLAIGMTLGFIGDLFMAQLLPLKDYVLGGIGSFGLGHVAYIIGLWHYADSAALTDSGARWGALIVWLFVAAVAWYIVVYRGHDHTVLHIAALPYSLLLAGTAGLATGLALQEAAFIPVAIGAALFLTSDLILAAQLFNHLHFRLIGDVIWLTYGPGQMLIVAGIFLAADM